MSCKKPIFYSVFFLILTVSPESFSQEPTGFWDVKSDTWVATDLLGRALPGFEQTGPVREEKAVALFYFLWNGRHGEAGPYDVSKILLADPDAMKKPDSPLWGKLYVPHHWGESLFGYYVGEDEWVLRKHAQMLGDAGVDVIVFDVTNQLTYPESYFPLCKVFSEVRSEGNHAPQIAFLTPFWSPKKVVHELWRDLYGKGLYEDVWYKYQGKPLILADPELIMDSSHSKKTDDVPPVRLQTPGSLGQRFTIERTFLEVGASVPTWNRRDSGFTLTLLRNGPEGEILKSQSFENHADNQWAMLSFEKDMEPGTYYLQISEPNGSVGWWTGEKPEVITDTFQGFIDGKPVGENFAIRFTFGSEGTSEILNFFTFRKPQPDYFIGPTGPNQWGWLEVHPQHGFYTLEKNEAGEDIPVIEQVAVGTAQNALDGKLAVLSNPRSHGRSFHQGKAPEPQECDFFGRNFEEQWARAYELDPKVVFITGWNEWIMGRFDEKAPFHGAGPVSFVDQFNREFSRDIEPMKGGHEDAFYYQMIGHIRRFKGTREPEKIRSRPIRIDGSFEDWAEVRPEFRDTVGDNAHRNERGWGKDTRYENTTGRNDIILCKVSRDENFVYFYVKTREPMVGRDQGNWMLLFIDADCDTKTGFLGYDFILNRSLSEPGENVAILEKNVGGTYRWDSPVEVPCFLGEKELELAIPRSILSSEESIDFKWSDNIQQTGDWSDFTLHGDSAPNDRYNYRARFEK